MWERTKNGFIQVHCSLLPTPNILIVKGNSKAGDGTTIFSSGPQFFTNYCDLEHPELSRAQGWASVKMCLLERSKLYINSLREQNSISFLSLEFNESYSTSNQEVSRDIGRYPPVQERCCHRLYSSEKLPPLQTPKTHTAVSPCHPNPHFWLHSQTNSYNWGWQHKATQSRKGQEFSLSKLWLLLG